MAAVLNIVFLLCAGFGFILGQSTNTTKSPEFTLQILFLQVELTGLNMFDTCNGINISLNEITDFQTIMKKITDEFDTCTKAAGKMLDPNNLAALIPKAVSAFSGAITKGSLLQGGIKGLEQAVEILGKNTVGLNNIGVKIKTLPMEFLNVKPLSAYEYMNKLLDMYVSKM